MTNYFFNDKSYPHEFSRHGDFIVKEARLLERHSYASSELELSKHEPVTDDKKQFVSVCRSECESIAEAERVRIKYMARIKRPKRFHILSGGKPQMGGADGYTESND